MRRLVPTLSGVILVGCNPIFGVDALEFSSDDGGGGMTSTATSASQTSSATVSSSTGSAGGGGSSAVSTSTTVSSSSAGGSGSGERRVFVTSKEWAASFGSVQATDALCQTAADEANLGGIWIAWTSSDIQDAKDKLPSNGSVWYRLDGKIVGDKSTITGANTKLEHPITVDESGSSVDVTARAWTGTDAFGASSTKSCKQWTSESIGELGTYGVVYDDDKTWTDKTTQKCVYAAHLYCFEVAPGP